MTNIADFGFLSDGPKVDLVSLSSGELQMDVITYGAVIQNLEFKGKTMVLGLNSAQEYEEHSPHFGAIAGRVANRIEMGKLSVGGKSYQLDINEGKNHLHGGRSGFGKRIWTIADHGLDWVKLTLRSGDGEMGYPGNMDIECLYKLNGNIVEITLCGQTDADTHINLAAHSYFNLGGSHDILNHRLQICADAVTTIRDDLIPTGVVKGVAGTVFDFRKMRRVGGEEGSLPEKYDINYVCKTEKQSEPYRVASLQNPESGIGLDIHSTEPGLQLYTGSKLDLSIPGLHGAKYSQFAGVCLEPQLFPDAIHHPHFPQTLLEAGKKYEQITHYRFYEI